MAESMYAANKYSVDGPSVGIVLGSGGLLGSSFHAGVLHALHETWGIDARDVTELLGTSAGAIASALVAAGMSPADLMRREQRLPLSAQGEAIMKRVAAGNGSSGSRKRSSPVFGFGFAQAPQLMWPAMRRPGSVRPGTVAAGLLPRGQHSTAAIGETIDAVLGESWPTQPRLRCVAVSLRDGRRRIFSAADGIAPGDAVAASCAVPGMYRPVRINGDDFIDGATHSANHVDAVGRHDVVIVSSPSTAFAGARTPGPWSMARRTMSSQLRSEVAALGEHVHVITIEPDQRLLDVMGTDPMAMANRAAVAVAAHAAAAEIFRTCSNPFQ